MKRIEAYPPSVCLSYDPEAVGVPTLILPIEDTVIVFRDKQWAGQVGLALAQWAMSTQTPAK